MEFINLFLILFLIVIVWKQYDYIRDVENRAERALNEQLEMIEELKQPVTLKTNNNGIGLDNTGHTIIVGKSGSGKSNLAMLAIIERIKNKQELYAIDSKQEIQPIFGNYFKEIVDIDRAEYLIKKLLEIAKERRELFNVTSTNMGLPIRDIGEYKRSTTKILPIITLVVEELVVLADIIDMDLLIQLLVLGRSAGVFVLALSQYLKNDILDRKGSINFNTKIFLGTYDRISVNILFGSITKQIRDAYTAFLGLPGKAIIEDSRGIRTIEIERLEDEDLIPYIRG